MNSVLIPSRTDSRRRYSNVAPPLPTRRQPPLQVGITTSTTNLTTKSTAKPTTMDSRYYRPSSPRTRAGHQARASTGNFAEPYYDASYYREARPSSPRTSGERITGSHHQTYAYPPSSSSGTRASNSTPKIDPYSERRRRNTVDTDKRNVRPVSALPIVRAPGVQTQHDRPSSPLARSWDTRGDAYIAHGSSRHKKLYSVDDSSHSAKLVAEKEIIEPRRRESNDSRGYSITSGGRGYHQNKPVVRTADVADEGYSYTNAAGMFDNTEPIWRRPRSSSHERKARPTSMIMDRAPRASDRALGPPPSTRGFDKIHNGIGRNGSVRDRHVTSASQERTRDAPKYDSYPEAPIVRAASTRHHAPAVHQESRGRDAYQDGYDRRGSRDLDNRHQNTADRFEDREVASRGFGIASANPTLAHDHHILDRQPVWNAQEIGRARPDEYGAQPYYPPPPDRADVRISELRMPDSRIPEPRMPDSRISELRMPDSRLPEPRMPDSRIPEPRMPDSRIPEPRMPDSRISELRMPDSRISELRMPDPRIPETRVPDVRIADPRQLDSRIPDTRIPDTRASRERDVAPTYDERPRDRDRDRRVTHADDRGSRIAPAVAGVAAGAAAATYGANEILKSRERDRDREREIERERERERRKERDERERRDRGVDDRREREPEDRRDRAPEDRRDRPAEDLRDRAQEERERTIPAALPPAAANTLFEDAERAAEERRHEGNGRERERERERKPRKGHSSDDSSEERLRHYVDRETVRESERHKESVPNEIALDPDEEYRRRIQLEAERSGRVGRDKELEESDRHRERRRRRDDRSRSRDGSDDARSRGADRPATAFDTNMVQEPESLTSLAGERDSSRSVQIVAPPKEPQPAPKGILRRPTEKFPEHPEPIREGVAPHKSQLKGKDIPVDARWTKIDRRLVNPDALEAAKERFEERQDCVIVLRVLTKAEIQKLADRTKAIREAREDEYEPREKDRDRRSHRSHRDDEDRDLDRHRDDDSDDVYSGRDHERDRP